MRCSLLVIGGGLSGLAAAIRAARFHPDVLLVEKHSRLGGLNSYFYRNDTLFETGLHAITNHAAAGDRKAPLNRLLRQLKLQRGDFSFCQQLGSEIRFLGQASLLFSNDPEVLFAEVRAQFPESWARFQRLLSLVADYDPFTPAPFRSARATLGEVLDNPLLTEMILCPLMYYGSSRADDIDLGQFVIMFRSLFLEGLFRPAGSIKDILEVLAGQLRALGGTIRTNCAVHELLTAGDHVIGAQIGKGERVECDRVISTVGHRETLRLLGRSENAACEPTARLSFVENIFQHQPWPEWQSLPKRTIIFFNRGERFSFHSPQSQGVDFTSGVICFPSHFEGMPGRSLDELRTTHLASYGYWKALAGTPGRYLDEKRQTARKSAQTLADLFGSFPANIVYEDTFTPVTIERYTGKIDGAIYGSPVKFPDGRFGCDNCFLAGTDQGFLGIVGSMLSGVSMVNQHILPRL